MKQKITQKDIAVKLGVSEATVSRSLANKYGPSNELRAKIRIAALDMGYWKHNIGGSKAVNSIRIVLDRGDLNDIHYYSKLLEGVESSATANKIKLHLSVFDPGLETNFSGSSNEKADGIIILGTIRDVDFSGFLQIGTPILLLDTTQYYPYADFVCADNFHGGYNAVSYLISKNHKKIAFVGSPVYAQSFKERLRGFCACVEENSNKGIRAVYVTDIFENGVIPCSREQLKEVLSNLNGVTAFVCANDYVAFIVYELAKSMHLKVPDDISVIGFDDIENCLEADPPLTSIRIPKFELGKLAVELMMKRMKRPDTPNMFVQLSTEIIERLSVADLNL